MHLTVSLDFIDFTSNEAQVGVVVAVVVVVGVVVVVAVVVVVVVVVVIIIVGIASEKNPWRSSNT